MASYKRSCPSGEGMKGRQAKASSGVPAKRYARAKKQGRGKEAMMAAMMNSNAYGGGSRARRDPEMAERVRKARRSSRHT